VADENCIAYGSFVGSMKERDHLEDRLRLEGNIKMFLKEYVERTGFI
jgi:hypothetical protein